MLKLNIVYLRLKNSEIVPISRPLLPAPLSTDVQEFLGYYHKYRRVPDRLPNNSVNACKRL